MPNVGVSQILLLGTVDANGVMAGVTTGTSQPVDRSNYAHHTVTLRSIGVTSGGTILVEEADWMPTELPYSGTWTTVSTIAAATFTGGAQIALHYAPTLFPYLRVRISSAITGGGSISAILRSMGY